MPYCEKIFQTERRPTREVKVAGIGVGGANPIRVQSMTTSPTDDVEATVEQVCRLADAGCEIVRVTVQGRKEALACEHIKNQLLRKGYQTPLVADIHFYPPAAMLVADFVDKIRINPGNFADRRASFKEISYTDSSYLDELAKIEEKFAPLVLKCKKLGKALRIGTNHGSLSDRIMNRYGDSPEGMVASAIEYAEICRKHDFHQFVFSMKSSNTHVMIAAYRLLCARMYEMGWDYPIHLGVTEAGMGMEGRVKSAVGIGSLLLDGIGDTIRVSLTEDPWFEMDPCQRIIQFAERYANQPNSPFVEVGRDYQAITKRKVKWPQQISLHKDGSCLMSWQGQADLTDYGYQENGEKAFGGAEAVDALIKPFSGSFPPCTASCFSQVAPEGKEVALMTLDQAANHVEKQRFSSTVGAPFALYIQDEPASSWSQIKTLKPSVIFLNPLNNRMHTARQFFSFLKQETLEMPVILSFSYSESKEQLPIAAAMECGSLLCDGLGEGVWIQGDYEVGLLKDLSFSILQGSRMRYTQTEFISCPSCGRTLFDLQEVTKEIKARTAHLPGVKIAVMGCIVNGPGEMADADFGYVGSQSGKIDLYVGKERVERNIPFAEGPDRLVALLKAHGRWVEPVRELANAL